MLTLHFEHPVNRQVRRVGPAPYFRITVDTLHAGPDEAVVGTYRDGLWTVDGESFLTIRLEEPARIRFEDDGAPCAAGYGPLADVRLVDGAIRHGPNARELLAKLDEDARAWYVYAEQKSCPAVVLSAG